MNYMNYTARLNKRINLKTRVDIEVAKAVEIFIGLNSETKQLFKKKLYENIMNVKDEKTTGGMELKKFFIKLQNEIYKRR